MSVSANKTQEDNPRCHAQARKLPPVADTL